MKNQDQQLPFPPQTFRTIVIHAELTLYKGGSVEACVMFGKRCLSRSTWDNETAALEYLASEWGLVKK